MNILYVHGFGSKFDMNHEKVIALGEIGTVHGLNIDYSLGFNQAFNKIVAVIDEHDIDLVVGTSLGGHMVSHIGAGLGIPFVAINPSTNPVETLKNYPSEGIYYTGARYTLSHETIEEYPEFNLSGCGIILLEDGDEVIDAKNTYNELINHYDIDVEEGGCHRYSGLINKITLIKQFYNDAQTVYGY